MTSSPLEGTVALVTGASRGIGARVAERLAEGGADVWLMARSAEPLERLAAELGGHALVADIADDAAVWDAVDRVREEAGGPSLVVNAAGAFGVQACASETVRSFDEQVRVNLRGAFLVVRAVLPGMLEQGRGSIVNIGSVAGRRAFPGNAAYSASKFGLRGLHEVLLEELRGTGVRCTLVEPAATDTALWDELEPDADPNLPDRADMLDAAEVAEAVYYVATRPPGVRVPLLQIERA